MKPGENVRIAELETAVLMLVKMNHIHAINHAGISGQVLALVNLQFGLRVLQMELWSAIVSMPPNLGDDRAQRISRLLKNGEIEEDQMKAALRNVVVAMNSNTVEFNEKIKTFPGLLSKLDPFPLIVMPTGWSFPHNPDNPDGP
jgi:hypothetical protein